MGEKAVSAEEALLLAEERRNARARACYAEIMQVAERHRCRLEAAAYITAEGRVLAQIRVVAV